VMADGGIEAASIISRCPDVPEKLQMRFIDARPDDWSPFSDRFVRGDWMQWPLPQ
jgi:hypothetical protein